jgi:hypothetical protein
MFVKMAYGEELPKIKNKINPAPDNMVWIRGMDFEPVLISAQEIEEEVKRLEKLKRKLSRK